MPQFSLEFLVSNWRTPAVVLLRSVMPLATQAPALLYLWCTRSRLASTALPVSVMGCVSMRFPSYTWTHVEMSGWCGFGARHPKIMKVQRSPFTHCTFAIIFCYHVESRRRIYAVPKLRFRGISLLRWRRCERRSKRHRYPLSIFQEACPVPRLGVPWCPCVTK